MGSTPFVKSLDLATLVENTPKVHPKSTRMKMNRYQC